MDEKMANQPKKKTISTAKKTTAKKTTSGETKKKTTKKIETSKKTETVSIKEEAPKKETVKITNEEVKGDIELQKYGENKDFSKSYLLKNKVITEIKKEDINTTLLNNNSFIFITNLNQEEEYNLEKDLMKVIKDNKLKDNFYIYFKEPSDNLNELFGIDGSIKTPTILYYKNGSLVDSVKREDEKMIEAADFVKLLDIYELSKEE